MEKSESLHPMRPRATSARGDLDALVTGFTAAFDGLSPALVLVFSTEGAMVQPLSARLSAVFGPDCRVLACSSAGGFAYDGYDDDKVVAIAFPAGSFRADAIWLSKLRQHMTLDWMVALRRFEEQFRVQDNAARSFGLLLIDGMSGREELVTATVDAALPEILVLGGSAGDGLRFEETHLALDGETRPESAIFCMISTDFSVEEVVFDPFVATGEGMVVTGADPENRLILEINAEPAAAEYARLIGLTEAELGPQAFAANPLLERSGGRHYVRAISAVTPEGALMLMSSIESGTILRIGHAESLTDGLRRRMDQIGPAEMVLGFDCVLRRISVEAAGEAETVGQLCRDFRIAGFNTYGEQHGGIHVNQTFVGLAFLDRPAPSLPREAGPRPADVRQVGGEDAARG